MKTHRIDFYILIIILLVVGCNSNKNDYSEIEVLEYRLDLHGLESKLLHVRIIQYANINSYGKCECLSYHCLGNTLCYKSIMIDKNKLSKLLKVALKNQHDTTMENGFNGRPFIKYIIHYQNKIQTITVVSDRLEPDNQYVQFFDYLTASIRENSFELENNEGLIRKRNSMIKSLCKNPFSDISLLPFNNIPGDFDFIIDTISK
jgi:hypothetical protein